MAVKDEQGALLGSYYLKANAAGPGQHVCNCGYMVTPQARGKGVASAMCEHSQQEAVTQGFKAMQFNAVVASNHVAVGLWQRLGFEIVGTVPNAYQHASLGYVDTHVMYKALTPTLTKRFYPDSTPPPYRHSTLQTTTSSRESIRGVHSLSRPHTNSTQTLFTP